MMLTIVLGALYCETTPQFKIRSYQQSSTYAFSKDPTGKTHETTDIQSSDYDQQNEQIIARKKKFYKTRKHDQKGTTTSGRSYQHVAKGIDTGKPTISDSQTRVEEGILQQIQPTGQPSQGYLKKIVKNRPPIKVESPLGQTKIFYPNTPPVETETNVFCHAGKCQQLSTTTGVTDATLGALSDKAWDTNNMALPK